MFLSVSDPIACRCTQKHPLADRHGNRELHEVFTSDRLAELPDLVSDEKTKRCPQDRFSAADLQAGAKAKAVLSTEQPHRCQCRVILPWLEKPAVEDHVDAGLLCHNRMFDLLKELSHRFDRAMQGAALATDCQLELRTLPAAQPMQNDPELYKLCCNAFDKLHPDNHFVKEIYQTPGSTDMGDVSCILPALHGEIPGCAGTCHGTDFRIVDPECACLESAKVLASIAVDLLYGNGETGRHFAEKKKKEHISVEEFRKRRESLAASSDENGKKDA